MMSVASSAVPSIAHQKVRLGNWTCPNKRSTRPAARTVPSVKTSALGNVVQTAGDAAAGLLPVVFGDVVRTLAGDAGALVDLEPSFAGLVRLGVCSFLTDSIMSFSWCSCDSTLYVTMPDSVRQPNALTSTISPTSVLEHVRI